MAQDSINRLEVLVKDLVEEADNLPTEVIEKNYQEAYQMLSYIIYQSTRILNELERFIFNEK